MPETILCLASYFKGGLFLEECKQLGCRTVLVTTEKLAGEDWPRHAIDHFHTLPLPNLNHEPDITYTVSYLAREQEIHRVVALDDYDVETGARLREHLRLGASAIRRRVSSATSWRCGCRQARAACSSRSSLP